MSGESPLDFLLPFFGFVLGGVALLYALFRFGDLIERIVNFFAWADKAVQLAVESRAEADETLAQQKMISSLHHAVAVPAWCRDWMMRRAVKRLRERHAREAAALREQQEIERIARKMVSRNRAEALGTSSLEYRSDPAIPPKGNPTGEDP
jgi:hypothetical protein